MTNNYFFMTILSIILLKYVNSQVLREGTFQEGATNAFLRYFLLDEITDFDTGEQNCLLNNGYLQ